MLRMLRILSFMVVTEVGQCRLTAVHSAGPVWEAGPGKLHIILHRACLGAWGRSAQDHTTRVSPSKFCPKEETVFAQTCWDSPQAKLVRLVSPHMAGRGVSILILWNNVDVMGAVVG